MCDTPHCAPDMGQSSSDMTRPGHIRHLGVSRPGARRGLSHGDGECCVCGENERRNAIGCWLTRPGAARLATGDQETKIDGVNCRSAR